MVDRLHSQNRFLSPVKRLHRLHDKSLRQLSEKRTSHRGIYIEEVNLSFFNYIGLGVGCLFNNNMYQIVDGSNYHS